MTRYELALFTMRLRVEDVFFRCCFVTLHAANKWLQHRVAKRVKHYQMLREE